MNVVNPVTLEKGLKTTFYQGYDAGTPIYDSLVVTVPSAANEEKYGWLGTAPILREWKDERMPKGFLDQDFTIVNKHYEGSVRVDGDTLEDDQTNQINMRVADMGDKTRRHPDSLLNTLITDAESTACYDGQFFFDTDHSEGSSGTLDNDLGVSVSDTSAVTVAEFKTIIDAAITALLGFKDDQGEPYLEEWNLDASNLLCMVPRQMRQVALETVGAELISNTTNVYRNQCRIIVNPRFASTTKVYFFYVGAPMKPFIFQQRGFNDGQTMRVGMLGADSQDGFMRNSLVFGVDTRYNMGYGLWQYAVLVTVS